MQLTTNIAAIGSVLLCLALASGSAIADQGSAFYEGKSFAGPKIQGYNDSIKSGAFQAPLTGHNSMYPSETQHYGDGNGLVREAGSLKLQNCNSYAPGSNAVANQECEAVNFLARNAQIRPKVDISKDDPIFDAAKNARNNADTLFHSLGIGGGTGSMSQCVTKNVEIPPTYRLETCHSYPQVEDSVCTTAKQFATNCAGDISIAPTHSTQPVSTPATTTNVPVPATKTNVQSCTTMCTVTSYTQSWVPAPAAVCSSSSGRRNDIINAYRSALGRCADAGGLDHHDSSGATIAAISSALMSSQERINWANTGFATIRSLPGFCGSNSFQNPNLCLVSTPTQSTYEASSCTSVSAGLKCSGSSIENTIIGYYTKHLGRCADTAGLNYYVDRHNTGTTLTYIEYLIQNSPEAARYAAAGRPYERPAPGTCGIDGKLVGTNTCKTCGCSAGTTSQSCTVTQQYQCPLGSTISGSNCMVPTLTCPGGGQLNGSTCTSTQHVYTCPDTTTLNGGTYSGSSLSIYYATTRPLVCVSTDPIESNIIAAYKDCLGRCADLPGLESWATGVSNGYETPSGARAGICNSPEAQKWNQLGKPTVRKMPSLCDLDKNFENFDKCRKVDQTYTSPSQISNPMCSGTVDYVDIGFGCTHGTTATEIIGSVETSDCPVNSGRCAITSSTCTPGTTTVNGLPVSDPCMTKTDSLTCLNGKTIDDCEDLIKSECTPHSSQCAETDEAGQCAVTQLAYQCVSSKGSTKQIQDCGNQQFNLKDFAFDTGYESDGDFGIAMALMEASREAGEYFDGASIFGGFDSRCSIKMSGLSNCCKKSSGGGGYSNNALFGLAMEVGGVAYQYGSKYMYDALYDGVNYLGGPQGLIQQGMGVLAGVDPATTSSALSTFSPSFSMYGFTASMGATPAAGFVGQAIGVNTIPLGSFGGFNFAFDPTSFAISIAIMVITEMLACDPAEQLMSMRLGQDLCVPVGTYCSKKVLRICTERKRTHCCFNSRLARIINEQGRAQLGKGWGTPKNPQCEGFTPGEIESIDFSQIDFSEFIAEIMGNLNLDAANAIGSNAGNVVQQKMQNYYERGYQ